MSNIHQYKTFIEWTGSNGVGTTDYASYSRSHILKIDHKPDLACSSDTPFRGEGHKHNPEDFLLASLSSCHMLWYLHLCADAGIVVTNYIDHASGEMDIAADGGGKFIGVTLHPEVTITEAGKENEAIALHHQAHEKCFIANSVNFEVKHMAKINIKA